MFRHSECRGGINRWSFCLASTVQSCNRCKCNSLILLIRIVTDKFTMWRRSLHFGALSGHNRSVVFYSSVLMNTEFMNIKVNWTSIYEISPDFQDRTTEEHEISIAVSISSSGLKKNISVKSTYSNVSLWRYRELLWVSVLHCDISARMQ